MTQKRTNLFVTVFKQQMYFVIKCNTFNIMCINITCIKCNIFNNITMLLVTSFVEKYISKNPNLTLHLKVSIHIRGGNHMFL